MKIAMSGSTGFVGSSLVREFKARGWAVVPLSRGDFRAGAEALAERIEGADAVVNLAGAPVIARWTRSYKDELYRSRVDLTRTLVAAMGRLTSRPEVLVSTSAIGIYASEGTHTEGSHALAGDFLGRLARDWEGEAMKARELGVRTVIFRFGVVLGKGGGALGAMLPPFRLGLGGTVGDGSQAFSWVHMDDLVRAYAAALEDKAYEGVYNLVSPNPTTNRGLTKALGRALGRPAFLRVPHFVLRLQFGEGAEVLTKGQRVLPARLLERGFQFEFAEIEGALKDCVKR